MKFLRILSFIVPVIMKKIITPKRLALLFLFGFLFYFLYPFSSPSFGASQNNCPDFPEDGFHWNLNALDNWKYTKDHPEYICTGLIYVNSEPFKNECGEQFSSGEIFLFPGMSCSNDCNLCPTNEKERPKINCKVNCPLTHPKIRKTFHQQLIDITTERASDFMGFSVEFDEDNDSIIIKYNSYTCNEQWFGNGKKQIGKCDGIDWHNKLKIYLEKELKL